ncbi:hypothetical protein RRF57_010804 [Xylaria bambusicola]|uniref:Uncharacterized protein n=1 Tax=Xylaria bambusicola TaxID=326684 RepID=A0AAN7Z9Q8_9PEZI
MGENGSWYLGLGVADKLPMVRPWKEPWNETNSNLEPEGSTILPTLRENLIAASLASEPELQTKTDEASCMAPDSNVFSTKSPDSAPIHGLK